MYKYNHARTQIFLSFTFLDGSIQKMEYPINEPLFCLENVKNYIKTGKWAEDKRIVHIYPGCTSEGTTHSKAIYEDLFDHINAHVASKCAEDKKYAELIMSALSAQAKEKGVSLGTFKAKITRMRKKPTESWIIPHEYHTILNQYKLFNIVDFDYQEPVCKCCGKTYPTQYTLSADNDTYCISCATKIALLDTNAPHNKIIYNCPETGASLTTKNVISIKSALMEAPYKICSFTKEEIEEATRHILNDLSLFTLFVEKIAAYYNAGAENKSISDIYDRVWKEFSIEKFNANINGITYANFEMGVSTIAETLLFPRYDIEDVKILLKNLI